MTDLKKIESKIEHKYLEPAPAATRLEKSAEQLANAKKIHGMYATPEVGAKLYSVAKAAGQSVAASAKGYAYSPLTVSKSRNVNPSEMSSQELAKSYST